MPISLRDVARVTGGRVVGDPDVQIRDLAPLADASPDHLGLLSSRRYVNAAGRSRAGALLVAEELLEALGDDPRPRVVVRDAQAALVPLLEHLHPEPEAPVGVHPTAVLGESVSLGPDVHVGPYTVLGEGVVVADGARIAGHVTVGRDCRIGEGTVIHPSVVLYPRTVIGRRVVIHAGARIGVDGFGFARVDGSYRKIPQVGRVVVEDDVEIGANTCIDRGSVGDTVIGSGSKLDNLVHIAHNVRVGERCAVAAQFGVAGSTRIGNDVVAGGQAGIAGHLDIGDGVQVAAQAGLTQDADPGSVLMGYPARDLQLYLKANALTYRLPELRKQVRQLQDRLETLMGGDVPAGHAPDPDGPEGDGPGRAGE